MALEAGTACLPEFYWTDLELLSAGEVQSRSFLRSAYERALFSLADLYVGARLHATALLTRETVLSEISDRSSLDRHLREWQAQLSAVEGNATNSKLLICAGREISQLTWRRLSSASPLQSLTMPGAKMT